MRGPLRRRPSPSLSLLVPALLLASALLAPALPAAAQLPGSGFPHVNPRTVTLAPGGGEDIPLMFAENPTDPRFEAGWVFTLSAQVPEGSAPMKVGLHVGRGEGLQEEAAATWTFGGAGTHQATGLMPETENYTLRFRHAGTEADGNATLTFFYDHSCNCAAKPIPVEVADGLVVFNADVRKGARWEALFFEPAVHTLHIDLAQRTDERSRWPEDFEVLQTSAEATPVGQAARQHRFEWEADEDDRFYFFVQSTAMDRSRFNPQNPAGSVMVIPRYEQLQAGDPEPVGGNGLPLGAEVALAALGVAALLATAPRRRR